MMYWLYISTEALCLTHYIVDSFAYGISSGIGFCWYVFLFINYLSMNTKKTFIFYNDWVDYLSEMTLEEKGLFLQAILDYQNGIDVVPEWCIKFIWGRVKNQLDSDRAKWEEVRKKRIDAGRLGWISKWKQMLANASKCLALPSGAKQCLANQAVNVNVNDNVNENVFQTFIHNYPKHDDREKVREAFDKLDDESKKHVGRDAVIQKWLVYYGIREKRYMKNPIDFLNQYVYSEEITLADVRDIVTPIRHKEKSDAEIEVQKKCFGEIGKDIVVPIWKSMDKKVWFVFHD